MQPNFHGPHATPTGEKCERNRRRRRAHRKKGKRLEKLGVYVLTPQKEQFPGSMHVYRAEKIFMNAFRDPNPQSRKNCCKNRKYTAFFIYNWSISLD